VGDLHLPRVCGKGFRQEVAITAPASRPPRRLLRECLGRVGEAEVVEPKMPTSVDDVKNLSWDELNLVFALSHASWIRAVVERGDDALRSELEKWTPDERATFARTLAEVG
jgi:hypothetical protein